MTTTLRPPMGWNSWDSFGTSVTEAEVLANARFLAEHLLPLGWNTVVVDIDWSDPTARPHSYNANAPLVIDPWGRLLPDPVRFPTAAQDAGFGPLAARVHDLGLRFGIHTMRGIPRLAVERNLPILGTDATARDIADPTNVCEWNPDMLGLNHDHPAAQTYYDSTLALYAEWGVDFIKADDMLWPYQAQDIESYDRAIQRSGRDIALSLSPGRDLSLTRLDHLREHATMWRICDDLWDSWADVEANFARFARWAPHASVAGWPDGDMLPLGRIGIRAERGQPRDSLLTPAEQRTLMTLWCIARSPLMVGGDLPNSCPETLAILSNPGVLALLDSQGGREVFREDPLVVWNATMPDGAAYVAAFNLGSAPLTVALDAGNIGFPTTHLGEVREVWSGAVVPTRSVSEQSDSARGVAPGSIAIPVVIEPHGCVLLRSAPFER